MMKTSKLVDRISGPASKAWEVGDRAFDLIDQGIDIIHLGIGDPDFDTPSQIVSSLELVLRDNKTHYSPLAGESALRKEIAKHANVLYGDGVVMENVAVCPGAQAALFSSFLCIAGTDDEVIALEPTYATYPAVIQSGGAKLITVKLGSTNGYQINIEDIKAAITDNTRAILINSPSNPSGAVFRQQDLNALASLCNDRGIWLVSDEVYWSLSYENKHASAYTQKATRDSVIVVNSLSKSHAMSGWRIGWVIAPPKIIDALTSLSQAQYFGVSQFVQLAAIEALKDNQSPKHFHDIFLSRRDAFVDGLRKSKVLDFVVPQGGMFLLIDVSKTGIDGKEFAERLLEEEGVAVVPGFGFGASMNNTIRVGFLDDITRLEEAALRLVRFAGKLNA
ncbi:MAG: aminotransferase class I/II-fold pyridoxal phosphate-dependent enzyme [Pseudomonadota bacterium]|nr:aminotransferase class I/II-fold pyridoxal phosphate-dependent enzyme [Pseudomonadota bacterium]